jgi:microcin C transport system substrate-binding protein
VSKVSRRTVLALGAGVTLSQFLPRASRAQAREMHGLSIFGDLKYPANYTHFEYVNPDAPKGGTYSQVVGGGTATFNNMNAFILRGDPAYSMGLCFASLMARAADEPDAVYGLAASSVSVSADGSDYVYTLRPSLKFHDGSVLTAADVVFSLNILKEKGHPNIRTLLVDMESAEADRASKVKLRFAQKRGRDAPLFAASLPIFSKTYYSKQPFEESTLEPPLGSGPYKVGRFEQGRYMEFERVKDWWGTDLPAARGTNNFDIIRFEYFRDRDVAFEAFTARNYLVREEFTSITWATRYEFPAMKDGRVKREVLPDERPSGAQGWFINTRREKFRNPKLREALVYPFDYEWVNKNYMYGSYDRTHSYFQNSDMMANGKPSPEELKLLEPYRGKVPEEVFGEPFVPPVSDGSGSDRNQLRRAVRLLDETGYKLQGGRRVGLNGEPFTIEFLLNEPTFQRHHNAFINGLKAIGIDANIRMVDTPQYRRRMEEFDFDIAVVRLIFPQTPADELKTYFSSAAASVSGSRNYAGISDPVVDALIEKVIGAESRGELVFACRALDRVLRAGRYWIPHWNKASHWIAYWDQFERPKTKPRYAPGFPETWWAKTS